MGRKRKKAILDIYVGFSKVGQYSRVSNGTTTFQYSSDWLASDNAFPISVSIPLSDRLWSGTNINSFFDGLLPDDIAVRHRIASREKADSAEPFDLLAVIGRDCIGALRFMPDGAGADNPTAMNYRAITDDEIASRLDSLGSAPLGIQTEDEDFRISIAGVQEKTAFLQIDEQWQLPLGSTPTSHIFKPAMKEGPSGVDFVDSPWNEWLCLEICRALGLTSANSQVLLFDEKPVIVVERFDRLWRDKVLYRRPQEDICQALGVPPSRKYQSDGGPGIVEVLDFLNGSATPREDRLTFMKAQVVFWLLAAIDGHAKNFSIFLTPNGYQLAPLYDVVSAAPYPEFSDHKIKLAMSVGNKGYYRFKQIQLRHFYQTAQKARIREQDMDEIFFSLATQVDSVISKISSMSVEANAPSSTCEPIFTNLKKRAEFLESL